MWFTTLHNALVAQDPVQGSRHFSCRHAKLLGHSELITHSGRQFGGLPTKFGRQEHEGYPSEFLHWELGPQGEGLQGFTTTTGVGGGATRLTPNEPSHFKYTKKLAHLHIYVCETMTKNLLTLISQHIIQ